MSDYSQSIQSVTPWNKGKLIGQKPPLKLNEIYAIRIRLQLANKIRDLALFNLAIDSKLRGCDVVKLKVSVVARGSHVLSRAMVIQQKTGLPVQFEITEQTRNAIEAWIETANLRYDDFLFPSRNSNSPHITTRQYSRAVKCWVKLTDLDPYS